MGVERDARRPDHWGSRPRPVRTTSYLSNIE